MDPHWLSKIDALKQQQSNVQDALKRLGEQCARIDRDIHQLEASQPESIKPPTSSDEEPQPQTGIPATEVSLIDAIDFGRQQIESAEPPPLPPAFQAAQQKTSQPTQTQSKQQSKSQQKPVAVTGLSAGEWELNFGQVWLVRIGVVFLLTGLIFLSTYAYKNWLFYSGPAAKVAFFMVVSMGLTGAGLWLEKWKERFKQYGRVVTSGGLSAGYYTLYAAHFTPALKIINSPILGGLLLTIWAGVMLGYAVWKKSRIVAVMAIGLAFYGTIINPAGWLSLFSSLLLSSAGIWLMLKFRWVGIGLGTVIAAYVAHAFWLGYYPHEQPQLLRLTYLSCYWLLFTAALAVPQAQRLDLKIQRAICAINNGAAWCLTVFLIPSFTPHPQIGWISMGIGTVWMLIAAAIRYLPSKRSWHPSLVVIFGYQGLMIASLGILLEATGYTRFLVLAVEACLLLAGTRYFGGLLARLASGLIFLCALLTALPDSPTADVPGWLSYAAFTLILGGYTALVRRDCRQHKTSGTIAMIPAASTWAALIFGVFTQWSNVAGLTGLSLSSTALILIYYKIQKPWWIKDFSLLSTFASLVSAWWLLINVEELNTTCSILPLLGVGVFWWLAPRISSDWNYLLNHTSTTNQPNSIEQAKEPTLEWLFSIAFWVALFLTAQSHPLSNNQWMIAAGLLAILGHGLAQFTQRRSIGVPACLIHIFALTSLISSGQNSPWLGWMPTVMLLGHLALADTICPVLGKKAIRNWFSLGILTTTCVHAIQLYDNQGLERPELIITTLGAGLLAWAYYRKDVAFAAAGAIPALLIGCVGSIVLHDIQDWGRYLPILVILAIHAFLWYKRTDKDPWLKSRATLLTVALFCLFAASSLHVRASFEGSGLSICWTLLAALMFCLGLVMRCRPYRLVGLGWLAAAIIHVVGVDVMRLGTLGRILSFITMGIVLLVLGFLYNRFQETIRKFI